MNSLLGIIVPLMLVILAGKYSKQSRMSSYVLIGVLALVQTCVVLLDMYTLTSPLQ